MIIVVACLVPVSCKAWCAMLTSQERARRSRHSIACDWDARSSANSLTGEFLGDYNYASETNAFAVATWNDVRNAADCPAIDAYRQGLMTETTADDVPAPAPATDCPSPTPTMVFGIFGGSYADPTSP